jgi:hypothetical protein
MTATGPSAAAANGAFIFENIAWPTTLSSLTATTEKTASPASRSSSTNRAPAGQGNAASSTARIASRSEDFSDKDAVQPNRQSPGERVPISARPVAILKSCTSERLSTRGVLRRIRCAGGWWAANRQLELVEKWPSWRPIACLYARYLPQTLMISFGIGSRRTTGVTFLSSRRRLTPSRQG